MRGGAKCHCVMNPQKIKILDPSEAIKIAAGEVIERPAHIIKELIENSIDAGAKNISLHLQSAGKDLIKITDDGYGMSPDDAKICFAHHATSKISTVHDLNTIITYGFRGEALSSIASVSHVVLITKTQDEKIATEIKLQHGKIQEMSQTSHATGTTLIISHLFDNVPARKKFLKSDETEWNFIVSIIQAFCLRYPQIHFKVFHNDMMAYNCPATQKLTTRCAQLWNNNLHDQLLELTPSTVQGISLSGAISNQTYHRFNRGQIFTFVNNRWVKNSELFKGILKGYDGVLPVQKFPAAFIFVEIDPQEIDINIHPKKEEVKFLHPGIVQKVIEVAVKNCLESQIQNILENKKNEDMDPRLHGDEGMEQQISTLIPSNLSSKEWKNEKSVNFSVPALFKTKTSTNFKPIPAIAIHMSEFDSPEIDATSNVTAKPDVAFTFPVAQLIPPTQQTNAILFDQEPYNIIGQFHKTYIMIEKSQQLIMIDQHAAHERILYERFLKNIGNVAIVQLLFPHIVKLTVEEITLLEKFQIILQQHGIVFDRFSDHEIIIQKTPIETSGHAAQEILHTVLKWIEKNQTSEYENADHDEIIKQLHEKIISEKACKAACKAGDTLNTEQMQNLIKELIMTERNFCCPHGRPTMWTLQLKEIEKHFKRDYAGAKTMW